MKPISNDGGYGDRFQFLKEQIEARSSQPKTDKPEEVRKTIPAPDVDEVQSIYGISFGPEDAPIIARLFEMQDFYRSALNTTQQVIQATDSLMELLGEPESSPAEMPNIEMPDPTEMDQAVLAQIASWLGADYYEKIRARLEAIMASREEERRQKKKKD